VRVGEEQDQHADAARFEGKRDCRALALEHTL
jgi:hypothetical protein